MVRKVKCDYPGCSKEMDEGKEFEIDFYSNLDGFSREFQFCDRHGMKIYNKITSGKIKDFSLNSDNCYKCNLLAEFYDQVEDTPRNYWIMTELFVALHDGKDYCEE